MQQVGALTGKVWLPRSQMQRASSGRCSLRPCPPSSRVTVASTSKDTVDGGSLLGELALARRPTACGMDLRPPGNGCRSAARVCTSLQTSDCIARISVHANQGHAVIEPDSFEIVVSADSMRGPAPERVAAPVRQEGATPGIRHSVRSAPVTHPANGPAYRFIRGDGDPTGERCNKALELPEQVDPALRPDVAAGALTAFRAFNAHFSEGPHAEFDTSVCA